MDTNSKLFLKALVVLVGISLLLTYYRSFVSKDFELIKGEMPAASEQVSEQTL